MNPYYRALVSSVGLVISGCSSALPPKGLVPVDERPSFATARFQRTDYDQPAGPVKRPKLPEMPEKFRSLKGFSGVCIIDIEVAPSGQISQLCVTHADDASLARESEEAVRTWVWKPAMKDGRAVACKLRLPVLFVIEGGVAKYGAWDDGQFLYMSPVLIGYPAAAFEDR